MNRRTFSQFILASLGLSQVNASRATTAHTVVDTQQLKQRLTTDEGLVLDLIQQQYATYQRDARQFILTFAVSGYAPLREKIYTVYSADGQSQQLFMTPSAPRQLSAVFNWRTNA